MDKEHFMKRCAEYATTVLAPRAKSWTAKFAIGAWSGIMLRKADDFLRAAGAFDCNGDVDVEILHAVVADGFSTAGHIDLLGGTIGFDPQDAEDFFSWIGR